MIDTKALRQKILDMAIRGKLVPQNPNDEPASVLLERIRAEKQQLIKEGKIKKDKNDSVIFKGDDNRYYEKVGSEVKDITDEVPFEIPDSWVWVRHNEIFEISGGSQPPKSKFISQPKTGYVRLYQIRDYGSNPQPIYIPENTASKISKKGDILLARYGASLGKVFWAEDGAYNVAMAKVIPLFVSKQISKQFLFLYYETSLYQNIISNNSRNAQAGFNKEDLFELFFPIPPLTEQERIVTRVDELFTQIDIIEQNQDDIDTLYDEFRKRTLTLAIQGKLVPQDSNDEPASVLLERIRAEKKAKLGKKYVDSYIYKSDDNCYYEHIAGRAQDEQAEVPFDIPDNWAWVRWGNLSFSIQYGYNAPAKESGRIKMVRISDIHNNEVDWEHVPFCDINETDIKTYLLKENDILFARTGGTVGKSYLVTCVPEEAIYAGYLIRTQYSAQLSAQYLKFFMESSLYWMQLKDGTIATAQPNCNGQTLSKMILPLPPLAEQKRIVAKINEMFAIL